MSPRSARANAALRQATRAKILSGSLEVFAERGFAAASMAEIARRSGVSKGLAYHYFDTKEALLEAALGAHLDELLELTRDIRQHADPVERLAALIDGLVRYVDERPGVFRLYLCLVLQAPAGVLEESLEKLREPVETYLDEVRHLFADLGARDPETDTALFRATLLGVCIHVATGKEKVPVGALRARLVQTFAGTLPATGTSP
jgi:AcrR family transcriptional regulator